MTTRAGRTARPAAPAEPDLRGLVHLRATVAPVAPYRLPWVPPDGVGRRRGGLIERTVRVDGAHVLLRAAQPAGGEVVLGVWAQAQEAAEWALARWRWSLAVDVDHRPFLEAAWDDPILGPVVRARPWHRPAVRMRPHEALLWAITEQLIEYVEAARIQRGIVWRAGSRCERTGLWDAPSPREVLNLAPAQIESLGLSARRTALLREVCRLLERGLDPEAPGALERLRRIPGLGAWTLACLALRGLGDPDAPPSGDLGLLKAVGQLQAMGAAPGGRGAAARDRRERLPLASEEQVHELLERYRPWRGYAAEHLLMGVREQMPRTPTR